jgi:hypothetical protein
MTVEVLNERIDGLFILVQVVGLMSPMTAIDNKQLMETTEDTVRIVGYLVPEKRAAKPEPVAAGVHE